MSVPAPVKKQSSAEVVEFCSKKKAGTTPENKQPNYESKANKTTSFRREKIPGQNDKAEGDEFLSLKQAKHDVFKYGIKGFSKEQQENAKIQLAIKLGAAPPKNKSMNYKEIMEKKQKEKLERETLIKENRLFEAKITMAHSNLSFKKTKKSANSIRKTKISKGDVGLIKGHIGSFSNGVLKLKKNDLKKLK